MLQKINSAELLPSAFSCQLYNNNQSGSVAVVVALSMIVLLTMFAFVIDAGYLYGEKNKYQNGVEAAAMAGAVSLCDGDPEGVARRVAIDNGLPRGSLVVQAGFYDEKDLYENFSVYKDFVAEGEAGYPEDEFNNAVMVKLNATKETLMGGFVGKDEVEVGAAAVAYLKRYGLLSLGQKEGDGIKVHILSLGGRYPTLFRNGDIHANGDIEFDSDDDFDSIDEESVSVSSGGSITGIEMGVSGADAVDIKPISLYVDELYAKADFIYTESDFPPNSGEEISMDENILINDTGAYSSKVLTFIPHECDHNGTIYYFDFSEPYLLGFKFSRMVFNSCKRVTNLIVVSNASIVFPNPDNEGYFIGGGGYTFQFISKKDIGMGGQEYGFSRLDLYSSFDGVVLMGGENVFLRRPSGGSFIDIKVRMIAGKSIEIGNINKKIYNMDFNFNTSSPCPPVIVKLGKL
jgi:hypothetical protein